MVNENVFFLSLPLCGLVGLGRVLVKMSKSSANITAPRWNKIETSKKVRWKAGGDTIIFCGDQFLRI